MKVDRWRGNEMYGRPTGILEGVVLADVL